MQADDQIAMTIGQGDLSLVAGRLRQAGNPIPPHLQQARAGKGVGPRDA